MHLKWVLSLAVITFISACSQTVSAPSDDNSAIESSSSKKDSSSSNKSNDKKSSAKEDSQSSSSKANEKSSSSSATLDEDCVGKSGNPWDGTTAKKFACGAGTKLSPYIILTAEQLAKLSFAIGANDADYQGKYFKLGADIILNEGKIIDDKGALVADSTKLHKWTPIGNSSVSFTGSFDGDGHTVSGMFINTTSTHNGLFGNNSGTVQNVTVEDSWVSGGKYTAGVVGWSTGTVAGVINLASVLGKEECVGGVIGSSYRKSTSVNSIIRNVVNRGNVIGNEDVGGVAGCATGVTVEFVENYVQIEGFGYVGGIFGGVGSSEKNDIRNLKNYGDVIGKHFVGGISGHCGGVTSVNSYSNTSSYSCSRSSSIKYCTIQMAHNEGKITGIGYVGGIVGEVCNGDVAMLSNISEVVGERGTGGIVSSMSYTKTSSVYNTGNISGKNYVGGIAGYNQEGVTSSAYSTGKVDGDSLVGLMIGYNYNTTMADYYYLKQGDQEPFGQNNGGGVATPKTADEMKSDEFAELLGDDFVYDSGLNDGYPVLKWEK